MITPNQIAEVLVKTITGIDHHRPRVINVNKKSVYSNGDLSFPLGLEHWRGYVDAESDCFKKSENILQYFMHRCLVSESMPLLEDEICEELQKHVKKEYNKADSEDIGTLIAEMDFFISNNQDMVIIHFNRRTVSCVVIKTAIEQGTTYGIKQGRTEKIKLIYDSDYESEITNMRLHLLWSVAKNLLRSQSYTITSEESNYNYIYTIKSEGKIQDGYERSLCGAVLDANNKKNRTLTKDMYLARKMSKVKELNAERYPEIHIDTNNIDRDVQKIAMASVSYELLSSKHSSPVIIGTSNDLDRSIKEASFILYNNVRITAILDKYAKLALEDEFPQILSIEDMKFCNHVTDEDSWYLIYNYIIKYPDLLSAAVTVDPKLEINIQILWSFVSNLCHDFSKYYRRNRILVKGVDSNPQILEIASERLHMLRALHIILRNSLCLLEVQEVTCM